MKLAMFLLASVSAFCQTSVYRFVGSTCTFNNNGYQTIGQILTLTAPDADSAIRSRCAILPDTTFQQIGFTSQELTKWGTNPTGATSAYQAKLALARADWLIYYSGVVNGSAPLAIVGPAAVNCSTGFNCAATMQAGGGTAPYTWAVTSGSLPGGMSFSGTGVLSGAAGTAGAATVTVRVTDNVSATASASLTITITDPAQTGGGVSSNINFSDGEIPAGNIDGSNTTFVLRNVPLPTSFDVTQNGGIAGGSLVLTRNGIVLQNGGDYLVSGKNVTFFLSTIPGTGDLLQAWYRY